LNEVLIQKLGMCPKCIARSNLAEQEVVRGFVLLREMALSHGDLARKIEALERKSDGQFQVVFEALRELMEPPVPKKKGRIGF